MRYVTVPPAALYRRSRVRKNSRHVHGLSWMKTNHWYCTLRKISETHSQPTRIILSSIDVETNLFQDGAELVCRVCRTFNSPELQKYLQLQSKKATVKPKECTALSKANIIDNTNRRQDHLIQFQFGLELQIYLGGLIRMKAECRDTKSQQHKEGRTEEQAAKITPAPTHPYWSSTTFNDYITFRYSFYFRTILSQREIVRQVSM